MMEDLKQKIDNIQDMPKRARIEAQRYFDKECIKCASKLTLEGKYCFTCQLEKYESIGE